MTFRRSAVTAIALAAVLALAGCTPPATEPTPWQGVVQTLASQASAGDYASATATLDRLEADVTAQRDAGTISAAEAEAILLRIAVVRADLASLAPAPEPSTDPTPEPTVEDTPEPTDSTVTDDGGADEEPSTPGKPDDKGPKNPGKGNDEKGNNGQSPGAGAPGKNGK